MQTSISAAPPAPQFERIAVAPAYRLVCQAIEREILEGRLTIGAKLPTELELAERFGVNRATVREGIRALEQEGFLRRFAGRRLFITAPQFADLAPRASRALVINKVTFGELWEVANKLEPLAARLAASNATAEQIDELRLNVEATELAAIRGQPYGRLDADFHSMLARAAGNQALVLSREAVGLLLLPAFEALLPNLKQAGERNAYAHRQVFNAVEARDADTAEQWMQKHLKDLKLGIEMAGISMGAPVTYQALPVT
jgi:GntR family transcriptional repressor for pyruvate dehydrogenase complex